MNPSRKEIVEVVMTFEKRHNFLVKNLLRGVFTYRRPKTNCSTGTISFQADTGSQNPYAHLRSYYGLGKPLKGQEKIILKLYNDAPEAKKTSGGSIKSHFKSESLTEMEKAINGYISQLVWKNAPVRIVDSPNYRSSSRFHAIVSS